MKIKKLRLLVVLGASVLLLAGCGNHNSSSSQSTTSSSKLGKTSTKSTHKNKESNALWNTKKDNQLKSFINEWAPQMHQSYTKYDGAHSLKTSVGTKYPDDLKKVNVEGSKSSIGWSKDGNGKYEYNVVAIYNYDGNVPPLPNHITYFFAFHDGQPVALVDQSRDGTPDLTETKNNDVKSHFVDIANGNGSSTSPNSSSSNVGNSASNNKSNDGLTRDTKLVALMVYQEAKPGYDITRTPNGLMMNTLNGRNVIGAGTGVSDVQFLINGDTVNYWQLDPDSADTVADETLKEDSISLSELESKYYSTQEQKLQIHNAVNNMGQG